MIEFWLILSAVQPNLGGAMFWRLLIGTLVMLGAGYMGESGKLPAETGFFVGMCGWFYILYEIFAGEAGSIAADDKRVGEHVRSSFATMRLIVSVGWSIYPIGYFFGYMCGQVSDDSLNLWYNLADFVNKIGFCLAIWNSAKSDRLEPARVCTVFPSTRADFFQQRRWVPPNVDLLRGRGILKACCTSTKYTSTEVRAARPFQKKRLHSQQFLHPAVLNICICTSSHAA